MSTSHTTRKNTQDIRRATAKFLAHFAVLASCAFLSLFFFYKSYARQNENIHRDVADYKAILNKQQVLRAKMDTIYYQMSLLNSGKVHNNVFLATYISENIQQTRRIIGPDSLNAFSHYTQLLRKIDTMLVLKNEMITILDKEQLALHNLQECMGKVLKVKSELSKDPTRGFQNK